MVERVLQQGGTIVGKTTCEDLCFSAYSYTSIHGPTLNPFDKTRISGGSSSGNAVALALAQVDMAVGSDSGCSIRVPASFCGCVGLKPTYGLVPISGCLMCLPSVDHIGPMARNVDVRLHLFRSKSSKSMLQWNYKILYYFLLFHSAIPGFKLKRSTSSKLEGIDATDIQRHNFPNLQQN